MERRLHGSPIRSRHEGATQRLAGLDPRFSSRCAPEFNDAAHGVHVGFELVTDQGWLCLGPGLQVYGVTVVGGEQVVPDLFGDKRGEGSHDQRDDAQGFVQCAQGIVIAIPKTTT